MGMTLCEVGRGLLEGLPLALLKVLRDLQEYSGDEKPCLVTHAGLVPLPVCIFTVLKPKATNQNPICKIRLTGAYAQHGLCFSRKNTTPLDAGWQLLGGTMCCPVVLAD